MWTLLLVCFFSSAWVRDILSYIANEASAKTLTLKEVRIILPEEKIIILLSAPKSSIGNKGHPLVLVKNPVARLCPVTHLSRVKNFSKIQAQFSDITNSCNDNLPVG